MCPLCQLIYTNMQCAIIKTGEAIIWNEEAIIRTGEAIIRTREAEPPGLSATLTTAYTYQQFAWDLLQQVNYYIN